MDLADPSLRYPKLCADPRHGQSVEVVPADHRPVTARQNPQGVVQRIAQFCHFRQPLWITGLCRKLIDRICGFRPIDTVHRPAGFVQLTRQMLKSASGEPDLSGEFGIARPPSERHRERFGCLRCRPLEGPQPRERGSIRRRLSTMAPQMRWRAKVSNDAPSPASNRCAASTSPRLPAPTKIPEGDARRKPPPKIPRDVDYETTIAFGQIVGRRSLAIRQFAVNAFLFTLRHTYLLLRLTKIEWVRKPPDLALRNESGRQARACSGESATSCHESRAFLGFAKERGNCRIRIMTMAGFARCSGSGTPVGHTALPCRPRHIFRSWNQSRRRRQ